MTKRITLTETDSRNQETTRCPAHAAVDLNSLSAVELFRLVQRKRRTILLATVGVALITAAIVFLIPNTYESEASLLPSGAQDKMADLKRLAGFGSLSAADENSSELFPEILRSRVIQDNVMAKRYSFAHDARSHTLKLADYFDQDNPDKLRAAINHITYISLDKKTGVIDIAVETEYPELSKAVLEAYLEELESFNLHTRRSAARDNATYLGRQIEQTRQEMAQAENELESYQEANRNWLEGSSPDLLNTIARLQREVEIQNRKYLYLTQEYEIAKLATQKDVPIVRILDSPSLPVEKTSPKRALIILAMGVVAFLSTCLGVVLFELMRSSGLMIHTESDGTENSDRSDRLAQISSSLRRTERATATEKVSI